VIDLGDDALTDSWGSAKPGSSPDSDTCRSGKSGILGTRAAGISESREPAEAGVAGALRFGFDRVASRPVLLMPFTTTWAMILQPFKVGNTEWPALGRGSCGQVLRGTCPSPARTGWTW